MWDYARMAQIAGKLGGPARTGALIFGAGMILGGVIVDGAHQAMPKWTRKVVGRRTWRRRRDA